jgi:hypothetical protein
MFHLEFCVLGFHVPRLGEMQVSLWDDKGLSAADINHERPQLTGTAAEVDPDTDTETATRPRVI